MRVRLGVSSGFAINRYPEPEDWLQIVGEQLNVRVVQFCADLLNVFLPDEIVAAQTARIQAAAAQYGVAIESSFTSVFTRVNHMAHPDTAIQAVWVEWFKRFADLSVTLGCKGMGSHFGIMSMADTLGPERRAIVTRQCIANWHEVAACGKGIGLEYVMFEPMSVPREFAATLSATRELLDQANDGCPLPMKLCLDVDHGDLESKDPRDTDPYAWLETFGGESPVVHIKQSSMDKGGHWPFTPEHNANGRIQPERVLEALERSGAEDVTLLLELNFRERWPAEYRVIEDLKASVDYWRQAVPA